MNRGTRVLGVGAAAALALATVVALATADRGAEPAATQPRTTPSSPSPTAVVSREPTGPPMLLPNMRSLDAGQLQVEGRGAQRRIRFSASLANVGPGPLLLRPVGRRDCPVRQHAALQLLHRDGNQDGAFQRRRDKVAERVDVGCMLRHPDHDHWHFDAMASYALRLPGTQTPLVSSNKVSFCLRDNRRVAGHPVTVRREHFGECSRRGVQGISPGWVDVYEADLSGQSLPLPRGTAGRMLCLDLAADPLGVLRETDEDDNATSVAIRVDGTEVRRLPPARCRA